jgi:hypothetical protein
MERAASVAEFWEHRESGPAMKGDRGALHELLTRELTVTGPSDRRFGFTFAAMLSLMGALSLLRHGNHSAYWLGGAVVFGTLALIWPVALRPLNKVWLKLGLLLHAFISPIVMAVMFFGVFAPMGAIMRLAGKDPLRLKPHIEAKSYWIMRNPPGPTPESLKRQF